MLVFFCVQLVQINKNEFNLRIFFKKKISVDKQEI
jgi:hypothetical protein